METVFQLQEWQIVLIGFIASILVQIIRFVANKTGKQLSKVAIQWTILVISSLLGLWWGSFSLPELPPYTGPEGLAVFVTFASAIVAVIGQVLGVAYVIYNVLMKKVFDAIGPLRL